MQAVLPETNPSIPFNSLTQACIRYIGQCQQVLGIIPESVYCESLEGTSSVGAHMRHIIERFSCFLDGYANGSINYDQRKRDRSLEQTIDVADKTLQDICDKLNSLPECGQSSLCVAESVDEYSILAEASSTVERELMSLVSHTNHHLAIIAMLVKARGFDLSADLGKAASTIIYENQHSDSSN